MTAETTSLREYQRELSERIRDAASARTASKLGLQVGDDAWLVDLTDAGEVVPVPAITPVPLTHAWCKGVANIRGNLYSVVDFPAFLGRKAVALGEQSRLLLISDRFRMGCGLLIDRALGLRNPEQMAAQAPDPATARWAKAEYIDADGKTWKELDVARLVQDPDFLGVAP